MVKRPCHGWGSCWVELQVAQPLDLPAQSSTAGASNWGQLWKTPRDSKILLQAVASNQQLATNEVHKLLLQEPMPTPFKPWRQPVLRPWPPARLG